MGVLDIKEVKRDFGDLIVSLFSSIHPEPRNEWQFGKSTMQAH